MSDSIAQSFPEHRTVSRWGTAVLPSLLLAGKLPRRKSRYKTCCVPNLRSCVLSFYLYLASLLKSSNYTLVSHKFIPIQYINMRFSTIAAFATSLAVVSAQTPDLSQVPDCAVRLFPSSIKRLCWSIAGCLPCGCHPWIWLQCYRCNMPVHHWSIRHHQLTRVLHPLQLLGWRRC